jgi:hypothetical protein
MCDFYVDKVSIREYTTHMMIINGDKKDVSISRQYEN